MPSVGSDMGKESEYTLEDGPLKGRKLRLVFGDYAKEMDRVTRYCKKAAENASNGTQKDMYLAYAESFEEGSSEVFKNSQRFWIRYAEVRLCFDRNQNFSCKALCRLFLTPCPKVCLGQSQCFAENTESRRLR